MLLLTSATAPDADSIASVHMAAFGNNAMLLAQFPTAAVRRDLEKCIAEKVLADSKDPMMRILVVRDNDEVISFAKWHLPIRSSEYEESPWNWPRGTNMVVLNSWVEMVEATKQKVLGDAPHYALSFIGTHPSHSRRGAASLLLQWGLARCVEESVPAYLESTSEAAALYDKHGFEVVGTVALDLDTGKGTTTTYEETCFFFRPDTKKSGSIRDST